MENRLRALETRMFQTEMAIMDVDYGHQMHYCLTQLRQINRKLETIERLFENLKIVSAQAFDELHEWMK